MVGQQVVAPADRCSQRLLAGRQVACAGVEQRLAMVQPLQHRRRAQDGGPRRGQFDGERQAVEASDEVRHGAHVLLREGEPRRSRRGTLDEQRHRLGPYDVLERHRFRSDDLQWPKRDDLLAANAKGGPARHQYRQFRGRRQELREHGGPVQHLLEVVQQQQEPSPSQVLVECLPHRSFPALLANRERCGDRGHEQSGIGHRCEVDEKRPVREVASDRAGGFQSETRLAGAPRPGDGEQAGRRQQRCHLCDLRLAADERGQLRGQVRRRPDADRSSRRDRHGRWPLGTSGTRIVLEYLRLEVAQLRAGVEAELVGEQLPVLPKGLEGFPRPAIRVQGTHQQLERPLPQRLPSHHLAGGRDGVGRGAGSHEQRSPVLQRRHPELLEPRGRRGGEAVGECTVGGTSPQSQRVVEQRACPRRVGRPDRASGAVVRLEALRVDGRRVGDQHVARRPRDDRRAHRPEPGPQPGDDLLQRVAGCVRRLVAP